MQDNLRYSKDHIWVERNGDIARIGISAYAQENLGAILFLNLPDVGDTLEIGECFGDIESVKTVSDLISPVTGRVVRTNEELLDMPDAINEDPYACWLIEAEIEDAAQDLMDEAAYRQYRETL